MTSQYLVSISISLAVRLQRSAASKVEPLPPKPSKTKARSNKDFSKGQLYHLLANKIYIGKITHKKNVYDGKHESIIDVDTFEKVQNLLYSNKLERSDIDIILVPL